MQKAAAAVGMFVLVFVGAAEAAPPPNDAFNAAHPLIAASGSISGTNVDASKETFEANHAENPGGHSVWYRWFAPFTGLAVVDTCSAATFDTLIGIYTGPGLLNAMRAGSSNNDCGDRSQAVFPVERGTPYHIAVDGANGAVGTFTLRWGPVVAPANDAFAAAAQLSGAAGAVGGTTLGATRESGEPFHGAELPSASAWYIWTAAFTGGVTFDTCALESFDTTLAVYTGTAVSRLRRVAANDNRCGLLSRLRFAARRGTTYRIAVDTAGTASGEFTLTWNGAARPRNDNFRSARRIRGVRGAVTASNRGATAEARERRHARNAASSSMWYRWRAPRTMRIVFDTCGSGFDTVLAVYRGSSLRRARVVTQNNNRCARTRSRVVARVVAGVEYRIVVDGARGETGTFRLSWRRR